MKNEKNFYDILNSKFANREVPFDAENWNAMRTMIDSSRAAKKRVLWLVASLSLLLCAGGAFALYKWNNEGIKQNTTIAGVTTVNNTPASNANNTNNITPATTNAIQTQTANANSPNVANTSTTGKAVAKSTETSSGKMSSSNKGNSNKGNFNVAGSSQNSQAISNSQTTNNGVSAAVAATNNATPKRRVNHGKFYANSGSSQSMNTNNSVTSSSVDKNTDNQNSISNTGSNNSTTNFGSVANPSVPATASNSTAKTIAVSTKITGDKADTAGTTKADPLAQRMSDEPYIFRGKKNIFSIEVGTEYSGGWQIGSITQGQGFNPIIGVGYERYINHNWFIKTGLQFSTFGNMKTLTYNYQHSVGNEIYDSVITTKRLYFLRIPVQAEYFIGHNSSLGLGGSVWFLLGNSGYATTYQQLDNNPPSNVMQYSQNAPLNGYSSVNASAYALYRYTFSRKFSMYGIYYFEVTNMKNESFFGNDIIERTHGFQIVASYSL
jgi:hypothetical protein